MNEYSSKVYDLMLQNGYPTDFSFMVASEMRTEFTSMRMCGYISKVGRVHMEQLADEMMAIINDRDRIRDKHINEYAQGKINEMYRNGL